MSPPDFAQSFPGPILPYLLAPISSEEFLERFWGRQPLYIPGLREKFRALFSLQRFEECLKRAASKQQVLVRASFDRAFTHITPALSEAMQRYHEGATLCVQGLETVEPTLAEVVSAIRRELNFAGECDIRVYLSPHGQGFETHFDRRIATTLQIEGRKRWRFSKEVALEWPHYQMDPSQTYPPNHEVEDWERCRPPAECAFEEVTLEAGDLLCLPAGCWHSAQAIGHSLALNLAFGTFGLWSVLSPVLGTILVRERDWRGPPPPVLPRDVQPGKIPDSIRSYFGERLTELIGILEDLRSDSEALHETWIRCQENAEALSDSRIANVAHGPLSGKAPLRSAVEQARTAAK